MKFVRQAMVAAIAGGVVVGAAVGLAGPASADLPSGSYVVTLNDNGGAPLKVGASVPWNLSACGPDCIRVHQAAAPEWDVDLHLQGNAYAGALSPSRTISIDKDSLLVTENLSTGTGSYVVVSQLAKV